MDGMPSRRTGWMMVIGGVIFMLVFLYVGVISKLIPDSGNWILDGIKYDTIFCYGIPVAILLLFWCQFFRILALNHFQGR